MGKREREIEIKIESKRFIVKICFMVMEDHLCEPAS
jgi:hypothetical protein